MHFIHDFLFTGAPGPGCAYSATARGTPAGPCAPNPMRDVQTDGGRGKRDKGVSAVGGGGACMERVRWRSPMLPARCQHLHRVVAYPGAHGAGRPGPASGLGGGTCLPTLPSSASREQDRPPPGLSRLTLAAGRAPVLAFSWAPWAGMRKELPTHPTIPHSSGWHPAGRRFQMFHPDGGFLRRQAARRAGS